MKIKQTCKCETIWKQIKNDENEEIQSQISISEFALPRLLYRVCSPESAPPSLLPRVSSGGHANANGFIQTAKCYLFSFKLRNRTSAYVFHVLITLTMKKSMIASKRLRDFVNLHKKIPAIATMMKLFALWRNLKKNNSWVLSNLGIRKKETFIFINNS